MLHQDNKKTQVASPFVANRIALDFIGHLGSLYDACRDKVLGMSDITPESPSSIEYCGKSMCILSKGEANRKQNIFEIINIDDQLTLSILLNLTSDTGLAAIVNYPNLVNAYTRVLHYTYIHRTERYSDEVQKLRDRIHIDSSETDATHIITGIDWGIDIVIVLQLPEEDDSVVIIDATLTKYCSYLNGDSNDLRLTPNDLNAQKSIIDTKIYSNVACINDLETLHAVFHSISRLKVTETEHRQLSYKICSIPNTNYSALETTSFEQHLYKLSTSMKMIEACFNQNMQNLLCGHFKERFTQAYKDWSQLKTEYGNYIQQYSKIIADTRADESQIPALNEMLDNKLHKVLKKDITTLCDEVMHLNRKGHLISNFSDQHIQYCNVADRHVNCKDDILNIQRKLMIDEKTDRILCSNDTLNKKYSKKLNALNNDLLSKLSKNPKLRLMYADFSYSDYELTDMIVLPFAKNSKQKQTFKYANMSTSTEMTSSTQSLVGIHQTMQTTSSDLSMCEYINILLLGVIGAGKTTFINSIANYLTFQTIDEALSNTVVIPIPVSFSLITNNSPQEQRVEDGDISTSSNEDFRYPDRSTTQRCKSYVYNLHNRVGTKLRFIDTPGFGDIRGEDQDKLHMQNVVEYVKKIRYLNAICIFIKPNEVHANDFFQSYFPHMIDQFGSSMCRNIVFCFTHSRSISFMPIKVIPIRKNALPSLSLDDIPFTSKNSFYFDNETFRFLVASKNKIKFTDSERESIEMTWLKSTTEAIRLIRYIRRKLPVSYISDQADFIISLELEIVQMIHPILETIRKILRKIISNKMHITKSSGDTDSIDKHLDDVLSSDDSLSSELSFRRPIPVDFLEDYKIENSAFNSRQKKLIDRLLLLCHVNVEFAYFLLHVAHYKYGDPFLDGFLRMINEENIICENRNQNYTNLQLVDGLKKLASNYKQRMELSKSNEKPNIFQDILNLIKYMRGCTVISNFVIQHPSIDSRNEVKVTSM